jgi:hypothetical protein
MTPHRSFRRHLPVFLALLIIGAIYAIVSGQLAPGPRGLIPSVIVALATMLVIALRSGRLHIGRTIALMILGVVTLAEAINTSVLVWSLLTAPQRMNAVPHDAALVLLRNAALIWIVNILTFSLWYWEIDDGGPAKRHFAGYRCTDFVFPQSTIDQVTQNSWLPHYVDYLFLAFNTSTAFSPTDTLVLSMRAKLLMMAQALISLIVLAIIAARAINTL